MSPTTVRYTILLRLKNTLEGEFTGEERNERHDREDKIKENEVAAAAAETDERKKKKKEK